MGSICCSNYSPWLKTGKQIVKVFKEKHFCNMRVTAKKQFLCVKIWGDNGPNDLSDL